jgi:hypothetical protein
MATGSRICNSSFTYYPLSKTLANNESRYALNSNYGTADDLKALASALHDRGMYLMVDVVANHMVRLFLPFALC